ncbi:hypothetical protein LSCM1_02832 [Leishmania martiniquensis]|uniref:Uncharacterized protein n=1 Tax=Leishmania martiniquensis TaxID=1580590 RepID=A0A836H2D0_9TRYP|nr:hypothetical protein LSCM1_02832 [Leishmania martiniquensis]
MHSRGSADDGKVLIRLDTSGLESRLNALTERWEMAQKSLQDKVGVCAADVRSVAADVDAIQRFLLSYHSWGMTGALAVHFAEKGDDAAEIPAQGLLDGVAVDEGGSTEKLLGMAAVARRLLAENEALRTSLGSATAALSTHTASNDAMKLQLKQLQQQSIQQSEQLRCIFWSLRMLGLAVGDGSVEMDEDCAPLLPSPSTESTAEANSTEVVLSRSPLLLSFRQILLRDLTERLTSVVDQQSKDFHDAVAHLEDRLQKGGRGPSNSIGRHSAGSNTELQETVRSLNKRLKDIEEQVVKRDEFMSLMRAKADTLLLPAKADNAALTDLETRLVARCAELKERCAFADAERAEFRALLRSLIVAQPHPTPAATLPSRKEISPTNRQAPSAARAQGVLLGELLPTVRNGLSVTASTPSSRHDAAVSYPRLSSNTQQLYRVVGSSHGSSVHGVPLGLAKKEHAKPPASLEEPQRGSPQANAPPSLNADVNVVAIGMTATQGAYAAFVSEQLTRRQVASLPTLPYERVPSLQ